MAEGEAVDEFDEFYRSSRARLATQLTALMGDPGEALDIVQEAFIRAWTRWNRIGRYGDPEAWVRRVAYHLAVGRWRRSRKLVLRPDVPQLPTVDPGDHLMILAALRSLPEGERQAIVLHYLADRSVEETAAELSAPTGTVKSWLSRGRARLAKELSVTDEVNP